MKRFLKKVSTVLLLLAILFTLEGCGNPLLQMFVEQMEDYEDESPDKRQDNPDQDGDISDQEDGGPSQDTEDSTPDSPETGEVEDGGIRYQKDFGSYVVLDGWAEVEAHSTESKIFYAKEGTENDPQPDNISIEVGTDPYSVDEHEEFARAIQEQLAMQLSQMGGELTLTGSGTTTENGEIVYIFIVEESGKKVAVQYYIVGEKKYCMVYETIYTDEAECDRVAQEMVDSFLWAE